MITVAENSAYSTTHGHWHTVKCKELIVNIYINIYIYNMLVYVSYVIQFLRQGDVDYDFNDFPILQIETISKQFT